MEDRRPLANSERRSAQQLERDNLRQRSFEARRAASQPQLAYDDEVTAEAQSNRPPLQVITPVRRGSHGNIMEAQMSQDMEKDSDDGGFLKRKGSRERRLDPPPQQKESNIHEGQYCESKKEHKSHPKEDSKVTDGLHGTPRRKLEGEIGNFLHDTANFGISFHFLLMSTTNLQVKSKEYTMLVKDQLKWKMKRRYQRKITLVPRRVPTTTKPEANPHQM